MRYDLNCVESAIKLHSTNRLHCVVMQGTPEKLVRHLVEDHSAVDTKYVEDFLLTYRTFLDSPLHVADKMVEWFADASLRDKVG